MRRRETMLEKLPHNANFFPLPSQLFLEDAHTRVSLHVRSPMGCASLQEVRPAPSYFLLLRPTNPLAPVGPVAAGRL